MTQERRTQRLVVLLILALLLAVAGFFALNPDRGRQVLADLGLGTPPDAPYRLSGYLQARTLRLASPLGGRVLSLEVGPGDAVAPGQVLARLDTQTLEIQQRALAAQRDAAQAVLRALEQGARPEERAVAQAMLELARAQVAAAEAGLTAARALPTTDPQRADRIAAAEWALEQARADLQTAQAQAAAVQRGASAAQLAQTRAALAEAEAALQAVEAQIAAQALTSPIAARVAAVLLHPGEFALPGQPVLLLIEPHTFQLVIYLPEADLGRVRLGQTLPVEVDGIPDQRFTGTVTFIANRPEFTPRRVHTPQERVILVYRVELSLSDPDGRLKPGLGAEVVFP